VKIEMNKFMPTLQGLKAILLLPSPDPVDGEKNIQKKNEHH